MGTLLDHFRASGIALAALPGDRLRASGTLTDAHRATIRDNKAAILAELAANDPAPVATPAQADELCELVGIVAADWPDAERAEAIAAALADHEAALMSFRVLARHHAETARNNEWRGRGTSTRTRASAPARSPDNGMRSCTDCANLSPGGRCLAAWRGESFGAGIATSRQYVPAMPGRPQRCGAYAPGPDDPDRRNGRARWPMVLT